MKKNLLAWTMLAILAAVGCKEVFQSQDVFDLTKIAFEPQAFPLKIPEGLPRFEEPADNPQTIAGVSLGRKLFHDPILSADQSMSCASCHFADKGMTDGKATSKGIDGTLGKRSSMSLLNVAFYREGLFWDGRVKTLEEQALIPVEDSIELHNTWENVIQKLQQDAEYPVLFRQAFGIRNVSEIDRRLAVKAIAQFERTLISGNTKFDQVMRGEKEFTEEEAIGYDIFFDETAKHPDAECGHCHNAPLMTTNEYFNNGITGVDSLTDFPDLGLGGVTGKDLDNGKFRVPTLRNIELTAPYMHDGRFHTLEEVVEHYNSGGHNGPNVSPLIRPLKLNETQKRQLIAFLYTLTDRNLAE